MQVTGLIVWVERWITEEARAQGMLNVFCCGNVGHKANDH